jgi:hypothetical protein
MAEKPKEPTIDKRDIETRGLGSPGGGFPEPKETEEPKVEPVVEEEAE